MKRSKKNVIGLDIGSSCVKMIQLKETKKGLHLQNFAMVPLPHETVVDGSLMNYTAIVDAIKEIWERCRLRTKEVAIGVSGHSVIIKKISLPSMSEEQLEESIQWEAEQYIPFDISDVNIDAEILRPATSEKDQMDVLLVAAKKDLINDYTSVVREAGLNPVIVDVAAFAVQNAFERSYGDVFNENSVLVNIGASVTNINVVSNGISTFSRDGSLGGNQFTASVQKLLNIGFEEAETLKIGGEMGEEDDAIVPREIERVLRGVSDSLAAEIQRSLDFYAATTVDSQLDRLYLSGGSCKIPALARIIETKTSLPVEVMNPFQNITYNEKAFDVDYMREIAPMAAVVVGLGLRKVNER